MLESKDFLADDRIYMPLKLDGQSSGGFLRIKADLLSAPPPEYVELEGIDGQTIIVSTSADVEEEQAPVLDLPGGGTTTIAETTPIVDSREPVSTTGTVPTRDFSTFEKIFIAPSMTPLSTFNIWIGRGATLVYSGRHSASFDISVPVNFFVDVPLVETSYETPPIGGGGGGDTSSSVTTYGGRVFGNPLELGDFGTMFMPLEGEAGEYPVYPVVTAESLVTSVPVLVYGYHPCYLEVISNGNTWRVHVELTYDYEYTGDEATYIEPPIIKNILINKSRTGHSRISWQTNVKCDRNWVVYGYGTDMNALIDPETIEASTGSLYPMAELTMQDGSYYMIQVYSEFKGKVTNSEPFLWRMPDEVSQTSDLNAQANSQTGLQGDGQVVVIESEQMVVERGGGQSILPILAIGGVAIAGIGGAAWFLLQRKKG